MSENSIVVWHPYPKECPQTANSVLITVRTATGWFETIFGCFFEGQWYAENDMYIPNGAVTAWAEKPKPYKEVDE